MKQNKPNIRPIKSLTFVERTPLVECSMEGVHTYYYYTYPQVASNAQGLPYQCLLRESYSYDIIKQREYCRSYVDYFATLTNLAEYLLESLKLDCKLGCSLYFHDNVLSNGLQKQLQGSPMYSGNIEN